MTQTPNLIALTFSLIVLTFSWMARGEASLNLCVIDTSQANKEQAVEQPFNHKLLADRDALLAVIKQRFQSFDITVNHIATSTWARSFETAKNGGCLIAGMWKNAEREKLFYFSKQPISQQQLGLFIKTGKMLPADKNVVLAVQRSSYISPTIKEKNWQIHFVDTIEQSLKMLNAERVNLIYGDTAHIGFLISHNEGYANRFEKISPLIEVKKAYLAIAKSVPNAKQIMYQFDQSMIKKGEGIEP
ncbi:substrate-binding periplasmic protein [Thalassotalea sp. PLHSN55]|uniref:substrate-binding periplasmic protein n=1 Tax=Thalassotalea sp. PLHSN55 TaxID=3435888 RepID=UPI003F8579C2